MDERQKRLMERLNKELRQVMGECLFGLPPVSTLYDKLKPVIDAALAPIAEQNFKVTPAPEPGDEERGIVRMNLSIATHVVADWPADRLEGLRLTPKSILDLYGVTIEPWDDSMAHELVTLLSVWERELRPKGDLFYGSRRITREMLEHALHE